MNRNLRIGIFTAIGVGLIIWFSVYVNDHPYWYRPCNEVKIHVDDATGLRRKSPVRTLGLEIGYINDVTLDGDRVLITVCVTGPVKLIPDTRAYIRSSGFLGDKFLELKPVDMVNGQASSGLPSDTQEGTAQMKETDDVNNSSAAPIRAIEESDDQTQVEQPEISREWKLESVLRSKFFRFLFSFLLPMQARAEEQPTLSASREAELQDTIKKVGKLIDQLTLMVGDLREVTQQKDFKEMIVNLNSAMKHLESLLRPTGKTMKNVDAALESLKNSMANFEEVMRKVNQGEGTIGKFVNDPAIFDELRAAIKSINLLLGKAGTLKTFVDLGAWSVPAYDGSKARFSVMIAPNPGRYYLLGISTDPRGREKKTTTTTVVNGGNPSVEEKTVNEEKGLRITALFGKYFGRLDLKAGIIEDSGAVGIGWWFDEERKNGILAEVLSAGKGEPLTVRAYAKVHLYSALYVTGGMDSFREYRGKAPYFVGAGLFFDDDDLKYLLAFR